MKSDKNMRKSITAIFFGLIVIASLLPAIVPVSAETKNPAQNSPILPPFQKALKESITTTVGPDLNDIEFSTEVLEESENHVKIKGTTRIRFDNPMEAGFEDNKWPKLEVVEDPEAGGEGTVIPGDYDQAVKDHILSQIQNIEDEDERAQVLAAWNEYDFESAPRTHIITEVYEITYPEETQSSYTMMPTDWTSTGDVLMGFTWKAPEINWIIEDKLVIELCLPWPFDDTCWDFTVYDYKAGFELDAGLGLRLPTEVTLNNLPEEMIAEHDYTLSTSIEGVNWDATQYSAANVEPVGGNEYVCYLTFFVGVYVEIAEIRVVDWNIDIDENYNKDFKTPFGPGEEFPIPDISIDNLVKKDWGVVTLGIGLNIDPDIGSETITADWSANDDAIGSGTVEYNDPGVTEDFGPVHAGEYSPTEEDANIQLSDFKYYFDECSFDASANIQLNIADVIDFSTPNFHLFSIDMHDITGHAYLGATVK